MSRCRMRFCRANALAKKHGIGFVLGALVRGGSRRVIFGLPDNRVAILHSDGTVEYEGGTGWRWGDEWGSGRFRSREAYYRFQRMTMGTAVPVSGRKRRLRATKPKKQKS